MVFGKLSKKKNQLENALPALSLEECLAKTFQSEEGVSKEGWDIFTHCQIVGKVARELIKIFPEHLKKEFFPEGFELVAACHDVGKVSPTFQEKIRRGLTDYQAGTEKRLVGFNPDLEKNWGGHAGVSLVSTRALKPGRFIPEIIGRHHGFLPQVEHKTENHELFGGSNWQEKRVELVNKLSQVLKVRWPVVLGEHHAEILSGLTTVADWIGSGSFFEKPNSPWENRIASAISRSGFITPQFQLGLKFQDIFGFPPKPHQEKFYESISGPGLYILEAPMGSGKTEASLFGAYKVFCQGKSHGFYFGLPTRLTSDSIHSRVKPFLEKILHPEISQRTPLLLHGNAWMMETEMGVEGNPGSSWFNNQKRAILAPFGVGTLDQALMAVLNVKHNSLRAFGLLGKVVILDEIHSYDGYTGVLLDRLIELLLKLNCTVILLSATLINSRKKGLIKSEYNPNSEYPLITLLAEPSLTPQEIPLAWQGSIEVKIDPNKKEDEAIEEALLRGEKGQQIIWIENSVSQSQEIFKKLRGRACGLGIEVGLLHSRFTHTHRAKIEKKWVEIFGLTGQNLRKEQGRILVGTQILEQSLDLDADFMISRLAPSDFLLQRMGRLWRHSQPHRPPGIFPEFWVLSPLLEMVLKNGEELFGPTGKIYNPYVLLRSLEIWENLKTVNLPLDIRTLLENTYCERKETGIFQKLLNQLEKHKQKLETLARVGLCSLSSPLPDHCVSSRYSELESVELLLLSTIQKLEDGTVKCQFPDGQKLEILPHLKSGDRAKWRKTSIELKKWTVNVPERFAPVFNDGVESNLKDFFYMGSENYRPFRLAKWSESGKLENFMGGEAHPDCQLKYHFQYGFDFEKKGKSG